MKLYKNQTLKVYLDELSQKQPAPGGGSAAALVAASGVALISMVAQYSKGKARTKSAELRIQNILRQSERLRKRLLVLVDLDVQAYRGVVKARQAAAWRRRAARKKAREVPLEVCRACYHAIQLTPFLVKEGNLNLLSDIRVAVELLMAAYNSALINVEINR